MRSYDEERVNLSMHMSGLVERRRRVNEEISQHVNDMRDAGMTWGQVAVSLETSTQAAWERYGMTLEQKMQRSRQNQRPSSQPELEGLERPREERIRRRKETLKQQARGQAETD